MSSLKLIFNGALLIGLTVLTPQVKAGDDVVPSTVDSGYAAQLERERHDQSFQRDVEQLIGGSVALSIGLYGYYNDQRGFLTLFAYSATQTAGLLVMGNALYQMRRPPSLKLAMDDAMKAASAGDTEAYARFKAYSLAHEAKERRAKTEALAVSSGILSLIYFYNGYRSIGDAAALRNVYYFLSLNLALVSGGASYRLWNGQSVDMPQVSLDADAEGFKLTLDHPF